MVRLAQVRRCELQDGVRWIGSAVATLLGGPSMQLRDRNRESAQKESPWIRFEFSMIESLICLSMVLGVISFF
jgi:hypothetical protein